MGGSARACGRRCVFAVLGNHDWWHGALPQDPGDGGESVRRALRDMGAKLLENDVSRLSKNGAPFWLAGLADQMAIRAGAGHWRGLDDLPGTLAKITDDAPAILLAHEPFIFSRTPKRVALTLSGHTHGGQINLPFAGPIFAELRFRSTHIYGHIEEDGRHLIISGGLGEFDPADPLHAPAGNRAGDRGGRRGSRGLRISADRSFRGDLPGGPNLARQREKSAWRGPPTFRAPSSIERAPCRLGWASPRYLGTTAPRASGRGREARRGSSVGRPGVLEFVIIAAVAQTGRETRPSGRGRRRVDEALAKS